MMIYHNFGCKISSSVDMVETVISDYICLHCDLDLEDSKSLFLRDTLAHNNTSPYQVWLQKAQQFRRYHPDEHSLEFWTFPVTLTTTELSNLLIRQSSVWWCAFKPSSVAKGSAVKKKEKIIFQLYDPSLWPWPWRQWTNVFERHSGSWWCIIIPSLVVNRSAVQKISFEQTFIDILKFSCDLDLEHSNPVSS